MYYIRWWAWLFTIATVYDFQIKLQFKPRILGAACSGHQRLHVLVCNRLPQLKTCELATYPGLIPASIRPGEVIRDGRHVGAATECLL